MTNQQDNDWSGTKSNPPTNSPKKWICDPNGWIAFCTIILVIIGMVALWISRDTEKRQLRAYVSLIQKGWRGINDGKPLGVQYAFLNYGQTPAKNFKIAGVVEILPFPLQKPHTFKTPQSPIEQIATIFPKVDDPIVGWIQAKAPFTSIEFAEVTDKDSMRRVYAFGALSYSDIFNEEHFTEFCFFMDPLSIIKNSNGSIKTFVWATCEQHNDIH